MDKTLGILVEGLIDTFLSLFHENKAKDLRSLDANGFCQLMLEVNYCVHLWQCFVSTLCFEDGSHVFFALYTLQLEYFETILNPYFTSDARESLKSLQGVLLEKATESVSEAVENPGHHRRPTRGSEDALDDRQQGMSVSPDDLIVRYLFGFFFYHSSFGETRKNLSFYYSPCFCYVISNILNVYFRLA